MQYLYVVGTMPKCPPTGGGRLQIYNNILLSNVVS